MVRYVITVDDKIVQILSNQPTYVLEGSQVHTYEGSEPDEQLAYVDGHIVGKIIEQEPELSTAPNIENSFTLEYLKQSAIDAIEKKVDEIRGSYSAVTPSQIEVLHEKVQEAIDYASMDFDDNITNYPLLNIEAIVLGISGQQVAQNILERRKQWMMVVVKTEQVLGFARKNISFSKTPEEVAEYQTYAEHELIMCKV